MQLRVLGPVELHDDDCGTAAGVVRGARLTRLLAGLAARANRTVGTDVLAEVIWPSGPPPTAAGAIQVAVSQARRLLGAGPSPAIITEPGGYRLVAVPEQLDLLAFEALVAAARRAGREGRPAARARQLDEALRMWRGPAFGGADDAGVVAAEARRLEELRLVAEEDLLGTQLQLGRPDEVLDRVDRLIEAHPYRERLVGLQMLALYRTGRQSDALDAYERLRIRLRDDVGLRPGDELRQFERLVLVQDQSLDAEAIPEPNEAEEGALAVHVYTVGSTADHAAGRWVTDVASLGGTLIDGSAVFSDQRAALAAARAGAADGRGCGVAVSSARAELLATAAPPGRILLDATVAHHLRAAGIDGVVAHLGEHQLADLGPPTRVAEWTDGTGAGGPIRSCSVVPTRLGADRTAFVGRRELRAALAELLRTERRVSLVGPPGAGKTRLARRVAAEQAWAFPGGAWFVDLAQVRHADDIPVAVAATLELTLRADADPVAEIGRRLAREPSLVVLDNADQIAGETAAFVEATSRIAPATTVLVTSRRRLGAAGEHVVPIGPLNAAGDLDDARTILRARVTAAGGGEMSRDDELAVVRRVDGLPLALELVAPQVAALGAATVLERLEELLVDDALVASFRSSEDRLTPVDRAVLRRASVFAGPFTVDAAEAVIADRSPNDDHERTGEPRVLAPAGEVPAGEVPAGEVAGSICRLVEASLLVSTEVGGRVRHRMLAVVRALAARRLDEAAETAATRGRHARWASSTAWKQAGALVGRRTDEARTELDVMLPDLRAALAHLDASDDRDRHIFAVAGLWFFWYFSGRLREGRAVTLAAVGRPGGRPGHRALGLAAAANLAWWQCDYRDARRCLEEARTLTGVDTDVGYFEIVDGSLAWIEGDLDRAAGHLGAALDRARATGGFELPMAAAMAGNVAWWRGDHDGAAALYREGREASIAAQNGFTEALCARHEALQLGLLGRFDEARPLAGAALAGCRRLGDVMGVGQSLAYAGLVELGAGAPERAAVLLAEGVRTAVQPGDLFCLAVAAPGVARMFVDLGEHADGARWLGWRAGTVARAGLTTSAADQAVLADLDREVAARLGARANGLHRAEGRAMSLDDLAELVPDGRRERTPGRRPAPR